MKIQHKIMALAVCALGVMGCEKHDFFDEDCITGKVGPEAYWEVASAAVAAGGEMGFTAQYYSSSKQIDHSEVWYSLDETVSQTVTCPWVSTFTYSQTAQTTAHKRVAQMIQKYGHEESYWSDSLHAYTFESTFPVSGTLSPVKWAQPAEFDSAKFELYFGKDFMQQFKDGIYPKMQYADYKKMLIGLGYMDDFKQFTDSALDPNAGENVYTYFFPKDAEGNVLQRVKDSMDYYWEQITFEQLIDNSANSYYDLEYNKTYQIKAELRVFDEEGVYSKTVQKDISII